MESSGEEAGVEEAVPDAVMMMRLRPPRLEEAGLEDCALPPDSIMEAISHAAADIRSRLTSHHYFPGYVQDPIPTDGDILPDAVLGAGGSESAGPLSCGGGGAAEKVEGDHGVEDKVIDVGGGAGSDRLLVLGDDDGDEEDAESGAMGGKRGCVVDGDDAVVGLGEGEMGVHNDGGNGEGRDSDEKPILVEGLM